MTITADFSGGEKTVTTEPLYQWDTGQKLALSGLPATSTDIQVHFANAAMAQAIVKATATENSLPTCDIPNEFLQYGSASKARAWVFYRTSNTEGYTVRTVLIPVTPRKRPNDYVSPEDPDSQGIVERAIKLLEHYQSDLNAKEEKSNKKTTLTGNESSNDFYPTTKAVADALSTKAPLSTAYTFDATTTNVVYDVNSPKTIYLNAVVDGESGIIITSARNASNASFQIFFGRNGTTKIRYFSGGTSYSDWFQVTELVGNKKNSITASNKTSTEFYPSIKAVVDYLASNYENLSNKKTTLTGNESSNDFYPTTKAVADALSTKAPLSTAFTIDRTTTTVVYSADNPKTIYLNAYVNGKNAFVLTTSNNYFQIALCADGSEYTRQLTSVGSTIYNPWLIVKNESSSNKQDSITAVNKTSTTMYPSIKAVVDYLVANYLGSGDNTVSWANLAAAVQTVINGKESASNKLSSEKGIDSGSTDTEYPSAKAVYDLGVEITRLVNDDISNVESRLVLKESSSNKQSSITAVNKASTTMYPSIKAVVDYLVANYENLSNKKTTLTGNESSNDFYPTTKAVADALSTKAHASTAYTFDTTTTNVVYNANNPKTIYLNATVAGKAGIVITAKDNDFQYFFGRDGSIKTRYRAGGTSYSDWYDNTEKPSNKADEITNANKTSTTLYPSIKAVYDYGSQISSAVEDVKAYIGYTSGDILGLHADFENKRFTRLGAAVGLTAGSDFNAFPMYGQRRRVVVDSNGAIDENESPENITENDTNVDVMVYQPKFYYKVVPLKLEKQSSGLGYHIRKANYYISSTPHAGFKLHPLFYDGNGNEIDYVLFSAYEASYMWRRQVGTDHYVDSIFHDGVNTDTTIETSAVLKSLPGVKPISGQYKAMNKVNLENCALRKSSNWHLDTIQSVAANQLLMAIEYGTFNTQSAIGQGIVTNNNNGSNNCASLTGSTSAETFNTASGMANETIYDVAGTETPYSENGKVAVTYRGIENPWGNIWKHINGINIWGDGHMGSGQAYIADGFTYNESSHSGNYKATGFTLASTIGYVSAFGYGDEAYDWLFMPSETAGNSSLPVGDYLSCTANLDSYRIALLGGTWNKGDHAGGFGWYCRSTPNTQFNDIGGRLLFVPTATV